MNFLSGFRKYSVVVTSFTGPFQEEPLVIPKRLLPIALAPQPLSRAAWAVTKTGDISPSFCAWGYTHLIKSDEVISIVYQIKIGIVLYIIEQ